MLRCSAVYLTGTYGATGGARVNTLPLPYYPMICVYLADCTDFSTNRDLNDML